MLLDVTVVLLGVGLAVAGFVVVVFVTALVLRLLGVVLGDGDSTPEHPAGEADQGPGDDTPAEPGAEPSDDDGPRAQG